MLSVEVIDEAKGLVRVGAGAIRGGGSNFGIVTHFTFRAHPVQGIFDAMIMLPLENVASVIKGWRDAMRQAPAELTTMLTTLPSFAAGHHDQRLF